MQYQFLTKAKELRKTNPKFFAEAILLSCQYACINIMDSENITIAEDVAKTYNVFFNLASDDFLYMVIGENFNHEKVLQDYDNNKLIPDEYTFAAYIEDKNGK